MELNEYVEWTGNTCAELKTKQLDNLHMILGMLTEVGELADVFKKDLAYRKYPDWVNVEEEVGDIMFYLASFCRMNQLNLHSILAMNVLKLETRYPEKFDTNKANNRDLKKERKILEESSDI